MSAVLQSRTPFQTRAKATWRPSPELELIALQRRLDRLRAPTEPELAFQRILHGLGLMRGVDYEPEVIAFYPRSFVLFDFLCRTRGVAFEIDGFSINGEPGQRAHDAGRDAYFAAQGIRTVRFRNAVVINKPKMCAAIVAHELGLPCPRVNMEPGSRSSWSWLVHLVGRVCGRRS
jgi:hypothetical protein